MKDLEQLKENYKELWKRFEELFPEEAAKVKFEKTKEGKIRVVGNQAGIIKWGLSMAGAVICKDEMKPNIPGLLVMLDGMYFTKDTEFVIEDYVCNDEIRADQQWFDTALSERAKRKNKWDLMAEKYGCITFVAVVAVLSILGAIQVFSWLK